MKHIIPIVAAIPILLLTSTPGVATLTINPDIGFLPTGDCLSLSECSNGLQNISGCCCKTGSTEYRCPTGWTVNGSTCSHDETTGSDTTGYYTQAYGTCTGTLTACYQRTGCGGKNPDGTTCRCSNKCGMGGLI